MVLCVVSLIYMKCTVFHCQLVYHNIYEEYCSPPPALPCVHILSISVTFTLREWFSLSHSILYSFICTLHLFVENCVHSFCFNSSTNFLWQIIIVISRAVVLNYPFVFCCFCWYNSRELCCLMVELTVWRHYAFKVYFRKPVTIAQK